MRLNGLNWDNSKTCSYLICIANFEEQCRMKYSEYSQWKLEAFNEGTLNAQTISPIPNKNNK